MATSPPGPYYFTLNESDNGLVTIDAPPGHIPAHFQVETYVATSGADDMHVPGEFVLFYSPGDMNEFYMRLEDFKLRVAGHEDTYKKDWDTHLKSTSKTIACDIWDDEGNLLGTKDAMALPHQLAVHEDYIGTKDERKKRRVEEQAKQWLDILHLGVLRPPGGRLWNPKVKNGVDQITEIKNTGGPLLLYLVPETQFLAKDKLEECVKAALNANSKYDKWLRATVIEQSDVLTTPGNLRFVSQHLVGVYKSYMPQKDIERLCDLQTRGMNPKPNSWERPFLTETMADQFHDKMVKKAKAKGASAFGAWHPTTTTHPNGTFVGPSRKDTEAIMGKSANKQARKHIWNGDNPVHPPNAAEWLHRSAFQFGPLVAGDYQSDANLVFGTYQANSCMTRAEGAIKWITEIFAVKWPGKTHGTSTLFTEIVNSGTYGVLDANGDLETITIPPWVMAKNYSWLSPELKYWGSLSASPNPPVSPPPNYIFRTTIHTLNTLWPMAFEGVMDWRAWEMYFKNTYGTIPTRINLTTRGQVQSTIQSLAHDAVDPTHASSLLLRPPTPPPHYARLPFNQAAWHSICTHAPVHRMGNTIIRNPRQLRPPSNDPGLTPKESQPRNKEVPSPDDPDNNPPDGGFTLVGEIELFGIKELVAKLYSWHGPPPPGDVDEPICQQAQINNVPIISFLPFVAGTPLEKVHLSNVTFSYQNCAFEPTKPLGWTVTATLVIDEQFGSLNQILSHVLQIPPDSFTIQVSASLGHNQSWSSLPSVSNFVVEGLILIKDPDTEMLKSVKLCDVVTLNSIGVRLFSVSTPVFGPVGKTRTTYGFSLFGKLGLTVPASRMPLNLDFDIREFGGMARLSAMLSGDIWENALGLGFDLERVSFSASFGISSPLKSLGLSVAAFLRAGSATAIFTGSYSAGGDFTISAEIDDFGCNGVVDLFNKYSGDVVNIPSDAEFVIGSASITLSNTKELSIIVNNIKYGDYFSANGSLYLRRSAGVELMAELKDIDFPEFNCKLVDVVLHASFAKKSSSVKLDVVVEFEGIHNLPKIAGSVHLYKGPGDKSLQWTVYAEFEGLGQSATLGKLFSELNVPELAFVGDVGLQGLVFIVASKDEPAPSTMNPLEFPIKKGVQICALIGRIHELDSLLRHEAPGLILSAGWSKANGFFLDIIFPTENIIDLSSGIKTDPIELQINLKPPQVMVSAGIKIPVPEAKEPLDFKAVFTLRRMAVDVAGEMLGSWNNPFGISKNVTIGPNLALDIGINLLTFPETGLPSRFGFAGGLSIGEVIGQVGVLIDEDPNQELISGNLEHLGIHDLVSFASDVIDHKIPQPPNFINFKKLSLYISTGVMIGTIVYPEGFSFESDIEVFGAEFKSSAQITDSALVAKGSIHHLQVGPLSVTGTNRRDAEFDLEISASMQKILVDGAIKLLDNEVALHLMLELLPAPEFSFSFKLHLTPALTFDVDAEMTGAANLQDLSKLEFRLHAIMEQHILEYFVAQVLRTLKDAREAAKNAYDEAEKKYKEAKRVYDEAVECAKRKLEEEEKKWKRLEKAVHDRWDPVIDAYENTLNGLEHNLGDVREEWDAKIKEAERALRRVKAVQAALIRDAKAEVEKVRRVWNERIDKEQKMLGKAEEIFHRAFARAKKDVDEAEGALRNWQRQIGQLERTIYEYEHPEWYEWWKLAAVPALYTALAVLKGYLLAAEKVLEACRLVLRGSEYVALEESVNLARGALETVKSAGATALRVAEEILETVKTEAQLAIDVAERSLKEVRLGGDTAVRAAQRAIDEFKNNSAQLIRTAREAIAGLMQSTEYLAYLAAKAALNLAQHSTDALDIAKGALEIARQTQDGILQLAEEFLRGLPGVFDITRIEVHADLSVFTQSFSWDAAVSGVVLGEDFSLMIALNMKDLSSFIHAIYTHVILRGPKTSAAPAHLPTSTSLYVFPELKEDYQITDFWVPTENAHFIVQFVSDPKRVMTSPPGASSPKTTHPFDLEQWDERMFSVIPGTGDRQGLYAIKGVKSGCVLYTRRDRISYVGQTEGDPINPESWFKVKWVSRGYTASYVMLVTPGNDLALTHSDIVKVGNAWTVGEEAWVWLMWSDHSLQDIKFDLQQARIISSTQFVFWSDIKDNSGSDHFLNSEVILNQSAEHTSRFDVNQGPGVFFDHTYVKISVPTVTPFGFTIDKTTSVPVALRGTHRYEHSWSARNPVFLRPKTKMKATFTMYKGEISVPCTIRFTLGGVMQEMKGIWRGSTTWGLEFATERIDCS